MHPRLIIVMGVSGCGKSVVSKQLAQSLGADFLDADDYHPPANIAKMSRGEPLNDIDRQPWLSRFASAMTEQPATVVGACSALKKKYREQLARDAGEAICFVFLSGDQSLIEQRMTARADHFMPTSLLISQLDTLEPPTDNELSITVGIDKTVDIITEQILNDLRGKQL